MRRRRLALVLLGLGPLSGCGDLFDLGCQPERLTWHITGFRSSQLPGDGVALLHVGETARLGISTLTFFCGSDSGSVVASVAWAMSNPAVLDLVETTGANRGAEITGRAPGETTFSATLTFVTGARGVATMWDYGSATPSIRLVRVIP